MYDKQNPTVLIYRRTHTGDPDERGIFGCNKCMGSVRSWDYDAVIGIGGLSPDKGSEDISCKLNWIGICPKRTPEFSNEPLVTFSKFVLWDNQGMLISECAPKLYKYMFEQGRIPRTAKYLPDEIYTEVLLLLKLAENAPPSKGGSVDYEGKSKCKTDRQSSIKHSKCK